AQIAPAAAVLGAEKRRAVQKFFLEVFQVEINDRRDEERDELGNDQAADDDQAEGAARGAVGAEAERDRDRAEDRGERVMRIGRKRSMLASWIAFSAASPRSTRWSAKSTIMMPFFLTMPISMNIPTKA